MTIDNLKTNIYCILKLLGPNVFTTICPNQSPYATCMASLIYYNQWYMDYWGYDSVHIYINFNSSTWDRLFYF